MLCALCGMIAPAATWASGPRTGTGARPRRSEPATQRFLEAGLEDLIENVPAIASGQSSYDTVDNLGEQMGALDPIPDPAGGYVGVYHTPFGPRPGASAADFRLSIAQSGDLVHWTRVRVLDPAGATMPTLRSIPGNPGYVLAYEKATRHRGDHLRVRWYRSLADVLVNRVAAQVDLPRRFSPNSNGTPSLTSIRWNGSLRRSVIAIGFHYETVTRHGAGPDREAVGTLRGFRSWIARRDNDTDTLLNWQQLRGNHGDSRQFTFDHEAWRLYEGQARFDDFTTWHVVLYDATDATMHLLSINTQLGPSVTSFGNPTAQLERAPDGSGAVLVVTMFIFDSPSTSSEAGELVYYQPIPDP